MSISKNRKSRAAPGYLKTKSGGKAMTRILILVALSLFLCSTASAFQDGGGQSTRQRSSNKKEATKKRTSATSDQIIGIAEPGFYITLFRCHACSPRQPDAMFSFRGRGLSAFYGSPVYDKSYNNIEFVEKLPGVYPVMGNLFVGPFQTVAAAQRVVSEIPSILRKQIAEDQRDNLEAAKQGGSRLSPEETTGFYDIEVRRVLSAGVTGSFASLPPEDFVIRPGIGVGRVLIGNNRSEVLAVLGKPREASEDSDSWVSGNEGLTVSYRSGAVSQISVSSSKFYTAAGLTRAASSQAFLKAFPTRVKYCCESCGASACHNWTSWDSVTKGIAMQKGAQNALIIHRVNEPVNQSVDADGCKPCR